MDVFTTDGLLKVQSTGCTELFPAGTTVEETIAGVAMGVLTIHTLETTGCTGVVPVGTTVEETTTGVAMDVLTPD
jgi:methylmalonyl-CoA mutase cobalamin-binding subunit